MFNKLFLNFPRIVFLLAIQIKKTAIIGNKIPFVICANFIISIDLKPEDDEIRCYLRGDWDNDEVPEDKIDMIHTYLSLI